MTATLTRETVYSALFNTVAAAASAAATAQGLRLTTSRRLRHWSAVDTAEMPILMMSQREQEAEIKDGRRGAPTRWTLYADFAIYVAVSDPKSAPAIRLNPLVDAVSRSLVPVPPPPAGSGMVTLGLGEFDTLPAGVTSPMVEHAAIEGKIETDEGVLGDIAFAFIPVKVLCKPVFG